MNNSVYRATDIAHYLIKKSNECTTPQDKLTHLKLQKILYYAQGWYLANKNRILFIDPIEAWKLGPAIRSIYDRYTYYGVNQIKQEIEDNQIDMIIETDKQFLDKLWDKYKKYSGLELVFTTHCERPWRETREGLSDGKKSTLEIPVGLIDSYFKQRLQNDAG